MSNDANEVDLLLVEDNPTDAVGGNDGKYTSTKIAREYGHEAN
jgi:hypothetical protein